MKTKHAKPRSLPAEGLINFGEGAMDDRHRVTVPRPPNDPSMGNTILAIQRFRDLTMLNETMEFITVNFHWMVARRIEHEP